MFDLLDRLKRWFIDLVKSRVFVLMLVFIVLSTILIQRVFVLQIVNGQAYLDDYKLQIQKTKEVQGTRGRILDRNGVVLADNKLAYSVTIEDNGPTALHIQGTSEIPVHRQRRLQGRPG